jgi:hypothetical protein
MAGQAQKGFERAQLPAAPKPEKIGGGHLAAEQTPGRRENLSEPYSSDATGWFRWLNGAAEAAPLQDLGARTFYSFEVFPSLGFQFGSHAVRIDQKDTLIPSNPTDLRDRKARNSGRNMLIRGRGEKQFVVVAAIERELQLDGMGRFPDAGYGNG